MRLLPVTTRRFAVKVALLAGATLLAIAAAASPPAPTRQPIAELLRDADGDTIPDALGHAVRVRARVTTTPERLQTQNYQVFVQDDSGGISLFSRQAGIALQAGDEIEASGVISQYRGAVQVQLGEIRRLAGGRLPDALDVTIAEADSWRHMGRRVRVEGVAGPLTLEGFGRLRLDGDDGAPLTIFFPQPVVSQFDWKQFPRGTRLAVTGVVSIYKHTWPYDGGFQLVVTRPEDIDVLAPPLPPWQLWARWASLSAALLLALSLGVFLLAQRRQRSRQQELATLSALSSAFAEATLTATQLARRGVDILAAYDSSVGFAIHLREGEQCQRVAVSAGDDALLQRLQSSAGSLPAGDGLDLPAAIVARLQRESVVVLASHPLPATHGNQGWLLALAARRQGLRAMQQRTLLAAARLLALAIENRQIREQAETERRTLHQLVVTDDLTGLYNRRFLDEYLRVQIPVAVRRGGGLAFLAIDIDHFKTINDRFGHPLGDTVLRGVAAALRRVARSSDLPVRVGGEEFLVVAAETELDGAVRLGERLRQAVAAIDFDGLVDNATLRVTVSVGLAQFGQHGNSAEALIAASDAALYAAKRNGRNRVEVAALSASPVTACPSPHAGDAPSRAATDCRDDRGTPG